MKHMESNTITKDGQQQLTSFREAYERALKAQEIVKARKEILREDWRQFNQYVQLAWSELGLSPYKVKVQAIEVTLSPNGIEGFDDFQTVPSREAFDYLIDLASTYLNDYANLLKG